MTQLERPLTHYFRLSVDDANPAAMMSKDEDLRGVSRWIISKAKWIENWPDGVTFYIEGEQPEDYLFSALPGWMLVSKRVQRVLSDCHVMGAQLLPVATVHKETGEDIGPYAVLNVVKALEALDWERTRWLDRGKIDDEHPLLSIVQEALRRSVLGADDLFRLKVNDDIGQVYVSPRLKECLEKAGATSGFKFIPVPVY